MDNFQCANQLTHLQCAIPVFEGLLESRHNRQLMKLLYRTAEWHALAKLRIHTDSSLTLLEELTTELGQLLRKFRDITCTAFSTVELPRETAARIRRESRNNINNPLPTDAGKYYFKLGLCFQSMMQLQSNPGDQEAVVNQRP
jgi:hypothetical protein